MRQKTDDVTENSRHDITQETGHEKGDRTRELGDSTQDLRRNRRRETGNVTGE